MTIRPSAATHAQRLERWLGAEQVAQISLGMRDWYGPPIALAGVPGRVYAAGGGEFIGAIKGGYFGSLADYATDRARAVALRMMLRDRYRMNVGFASLSDLIAEMTTGAKKQVLPYFKTGVAQPAIGASASLWRMPALPSLGALSAVPPGGTVFTSASPGAMRFVDPTGGDTLHFINWFGQQTTTQVSSLMLCDYLFAANMDDNTVAAQPITGVPTRYQTAALAPGNFLPANVTAALGATAQNITITYVDDAGNVAEAGTAQAVRASSAVDTSPFTAPAWFYNLNAGDRGVRNMTSIIFSAANAGRADRMIAHPIAIMPGVGAVNQGFFVDGINSAANLERIYDAACLFLYEWQKSATALSSYSGLITLCAG